MNLRTKIVVLGTAQLAILGGLLLGFYYFKARHNAR